ncbi:MAG: AarF/UbiB family protein [Planctomycetota bacterium]|nr:AarF/UbiB family protein [Planctomycetota bacterium]
MKNSHPNGAIGRGMRMGRLGLHVVGSYLGYQLQNLLLGSESREERHTKLRRNVSRRVREELAELKGPLMKFGQILSMQTQMLPDESIEELSNLQMRAPGMHPTLARAQFKSSLGRYPEEVFREFEAEPFAAASLGQVHRAMTRSGEKVAVKIQYPAIRTAIENDFKLLRTATLPGRMTGHLPVSILKEVQRGFLEETDYINEGRNIDFLREALADLPYVTAPKVYWDATTDRVLTMSYVDGLTIRDFLSRRPPQEVRNLIGQRLLEMFLFQIHCVHVVHADPHPGNYFFNLEGHIGMVDFGCVKKYSADVSELSRCFIDRSWTNGEKQVQRISRLLWGTPQFSRRAKTREMLRSVSEFYDMVYPPPETRRSVVDFADPALLGALTRNFQEAVRNKLCNAEFAFSSRAELGLYNLLHQLRSRVDTRRVWSGVVERLSETPIEPLPAQRR